VTVPVPPESDDDVPRFLADLGVPGIVDVHVHFLPERMLSKVWAYFDNASTHYGTPWPIQYRTSEPERVATLRELGVRTFAPLVYPHKPGMARWLTDWVTEFASANPDAVPTATLYPEPDVTDYLGAAVDAGARVVKVHVQVGAFDPRDPLLRPAWGLLADAGLPVVVHCGHGPIPGAHTGLDVFGEILAEHPRLRAVLAHAGMPDFGAALDLVHRYEGVHIDTTMVGTARRRRRPGGLRLRLPQHPLPVRRAGAGGRGVVSGRTAPRRPVPPLGAAHRTGAVAGPLTSQVADSVHRVHPGMGVALTIVVVLVVLGVIAMAAVLAGQGRRYRREHRRPAAGDGPARWRMARAELQRRIPRRHPGVVRSGGSDATHRRPRP
jgi:heme exporter protein D